MLLPANPSTTLHPPLYESAKDDYTVQTRRRCRRDTMSQAWVFLRASNVHHLSQCCRFYFSEGKQRLMADTSARSNVTVVTTSHYFGLFVSDKFRKILNLYCIEYDMLTRSCH